MDPVTHIVDLVGGYVDQKKVRHTRVVFGHRITAKEIFALDEDPQAQNPTQYNDMVVRAHMTEFGTLPLPVPLPVLLKLDAIDRDDLADGCNTYQALSAGERVGEFLPENKVGLAWGFKIGDVVYTRVQFGNRLTGMDEIEADRAGLGTGIRRLCFLVGKQISQISAVEKNAKGEEVVVAEIPGPLSLEYFQTSELDAADIATLRGGASLWRQSFRLGRGHLSRNGGSPDRVRADAEDRPAGSDDSKLASREA